ncbi:hypothetical protein Goklo_004170 [Gossypium klotzschianum]|uniref:Uncharacterized protein n=1 Tax=Gossypium klotzschianum TaxID=34286 RepID=A0A7J8VMT9_9ROSI|nr:hypothetical protein [Gossypium klotzschianum]
MIRRTTTITGGRRQATTGRYGVLRVDVASEGVARVRGKAESFGRRALQTRGFYDDVSKTLAVVGRCTTEIDSMKKKLKEFVVEALSSNLDAMKGVFNTVVNNLIEKNDALEAMVTTWKEKIVELKGELTVYKVALGNRILASAPKQHKMNFPKSNEFNETRSTRDVDNFLREVEQYFCTIGIEDDSLR